MATAYINPNILKWGRIRLDLPQEVLANKLHVNFEKYKSWETGQGYPTINQAMSIGKILRLPFGYLYLSEPPKGDGIPISDFRTIKNLRFQEVSTDLRETINIVLRQQEWYSAYRREEEKEMLPFVGAFSLTDSNTDIVADIRERLRWSKSLYSTVNTRPDYLRRLIDLSEQCSITVVRNGVVGNNTHQKLNNSEFRGFALCDDYAPYVFINSNDCYAGQIFTLAHELAHVWLGKSGISNLNPDEQDLRDFQELEKKCNQIAVELLLPEDKLLESSDTFDYSSIVKISKEYKISTIVILRRLLDTKNITRKWFFELYDQMLEENWKLEKKKTRTSSVGGSFYNSFFAKTGKAFTNAIITSVLERKLLYRDAADLLSVSIPVVYKLIDKRSFS